MKRFPFVQQLDSRDCGPACLSMIAKYYGKNYPLQKFRDAAFMTRGGVSMLGLSDAAEAIGFKSMGVRLNFTSLAGEAPLPCIAYWRQKHFVVVYKVEREAVYVADPGHGLVRYTKKEFLDGWAETVREGEHEGLCLLLEPTPDFDKTADDKTERTKLRFLFSYLKPHKRFIVQILVGMALGSLLQLVFPFLAQAMVDIGISNQNLGFVTLVLIAQVTLFVSQSAVEFIRSWILLHLSTRINLSLISDFLIKLFKLPIGFFDSKMTGDILQRIYDHTRIESFLTSTTLSTAFSLINLLVFGIVLAIYNLTIFFLFFIGSLIQVIWIILFMKRRRELDFKRFQRMSENQGNLYQLITGIQEIKLNNCEKLQRWNWERIQAKLFRISIKGLSLSQYQQTGSLIIHQIQNILITFFAARSVIQGHLTLGMMIAVQYIIGQLNGPIEQLIGIFHATQDAKISLERLQEIHAKKDEESPEEMRIGILSQNRTITISNLSYQYEGPRSESVLRDINLEIPQKKVTAIVGASGSGKTTLIKLLLGFYAPTKGEIRVGEYLLENVGNRVWRGHCGAVMQDGFIFSDTIAQNICPSEETIDRQKLLQAAQIANIQEFVEGTALGFNTKIGLEGHGLSAGQKQRILIARAIYKNPDFLFFDEATNALDANNERTIIENLRPFFRERTVVIVAHRLSTVKNADKIVVLEKGKIVEEGTHRDLINRKGAYYDLVKDQLALGA